MSVVLVVAMNELAIVMGDGRFSGDNGVILCEDYKKVRRINNKVCVGFGGNSELCEQIVQELTCDMSYAQILGSTVKISKELFIPEGKKAIITVVGFTEDNVMTIEYFSTNDFKIQTRILQNDGISGIVLGNDGFSEIYERNLSEMPKTCLNDYYVIMNKTIYDISLIDKTVNNYIYSELLVKGM